MIFKFIISTILAKVEKDILYIKDKLIIVNELNYFYMDVYSFKKIINIIAKKLHIYSIISVL
jgi:hypothetical protein